MNIELVDLKSQYKNIQTQVDAAVLNVMKNATFINGPEVKLFATNLEKYLGVKKVIPCANGTDALQIALMALGLKPGDHVITPSFTYIATAEVIALLGLVPVFVDVDPLNFTISTQEIEKNMTDKVKAIIPVHLYGQCANMEQVMEIANKHQVYVIEDNAQAIGATYTYLSGEKKKSGTIGHIGCTSFFPSKNLGCFGDGGAIFTNDLALGEKIKMVANHGQSKKYVHDVIGVNSRLDSIQAAVLNVKLNHLGSYCKARNKVANAYNEAFSSISNIITPITESYTDHVFHQYTVILKNIDREKFQAYLKEKGIPTNIYYPKPIHLQNGFLDLECKKGDLSNTEYLMHHVLSFPMHTEMVNEQLEYIIEGVQSYFKKVEA